MHCQKLVTVGGSCPSAATRLQRSLPGWSRHSLSSRNNPRLKNQESPLISHFAGNGFSLKNVDYRRRSSSERAGGRRRDGTRADHASDGNPEVRRCRTSWTSSVTEVLDGPDERAESSRDFEAAAATDGILCIGARVAASSHEFSAFGILDAENDVSPSHDRSPERFYLVEEVPLMNPAMYSGNGRESS